MIRVITIKINGNVVELTATVSLKEYLESEGFNIQKIAVERNGDIVPKARYAETMLDNSDTIEVVRFVGGG